eukprot:EC124104.1.p1 GENE.EC124104.1~~EC124104.1.p1  ORF type:complete len:155 (+),score=2.05 EC124104.1:107-571(+)
MPSRYCFAGDGSVHPEKAFERCLEKFVKKDDEVILLSVVEPLLDMPVWDPEYSAAGLSEILEDLTKASKDRAFQTLEKYRSIGERLGFKLGTVLLSGNPREVIVDFAGSAQVDFLVVASRGLGAVRQIGPRLNQRLPCSPCSVPSPRCGASSPS